jgi:hypothetical protein
MTVGNVGVPVAACRASALRREDQFRHHLRHSLSPRPACIAREEAAPTKK